MRIPITDLGRYGVVKDAYEQSVPPAAWTNVRNVQFNARGAVTYPGAREVFTDASVTPLWLKQFPPTNIPRWVYATLTEAWVVEDGTHTEITRASGDYSGSASERWHGDVFSGVGILNNTVDIPQLWSPMTAATDLVNLTNWPSSYRAKFLRPFGNFLVAGNIYDGTGQRPFRLKWSNAAAPGSVPSSWDHTDPANDAGERDLGRTSDELIDALPMGDINIIYRENSTWGMRYVGFPNIFATWDITSDHGIMTRDCAVDTPRGHIVATRDDLILHQGSKGSFNSLLSGQMRAWTFRQINPSYYFNCCVVHSVGTKEVWFCFPESGSTYATLAVTVSLEGHGIGVRELPGVPFITSGPIGSVTDDDTG